MKTLKLSFLLLVVLVVVVVAASLRLMLSSRTRRNSFFDKCNYVASYCSDCWNRTLATLQDEETRRLARCALASSPAWTWRPHVPPGRLSFRWHLLSTISAHCEPSGLQGRCSWVIGSRQSHYEQLEATAAWASFDQLPSTIFVRTDLLQLFVDTILPCIRHRFVLLIGDHDLTVPTQLDSRYNVTVLRGGALAWHRLLNDTRLLHIFATHYDQRERSERVTPLPLGFNPLEFEPSLDGDFYYRHQLVVGALPLARPHRHRQPYSVLVCDRVRGGDQFATRRRVRELCGGEWSAYCTIDTSASGTDSFALLLRSYTFVICAHGGGIDPNPKLFEVLASGSIPIIERFPSAYMYEDAQMPVVIVDEFNATSIRPELLEQWERRWTAAFETVEGRRAVLERLGVEYWWQKVAAAVAKAEDG